MCHALLRVSFRGEKGEPQLMVVDTAEQLPNKIKEAQSRAEAVKIDVFTHQAHMSVQRVEEWRSRALMVQEPKVET